MVRHWTRKPVIIWSIRSSPTGGNFFFAIVKSFEYKIAISANFVQTVKNSNVSLVKRHLVTMSGFCVIFIREPIWNRTKRFSLGDEMLCLTSRRNLPFPFQKGKNLLNSFNFPIWKVKRNICRLEKLKRKYKRKYENNVLYWKGKKIIIDTLHCLTDKKCSLVFVLYKKKDVVWFLFCTKKRMLFKTGFLLQSNFRLGTFFIRHMFVGLIEMISSWTMYRILKLLQDNGCGRLAS